MPDALHRRRLLYRDVGLVAVCATIVFLLVRVEMRIWEEQQFVMLRMILCTENREGDLAQLLIQGFEERGLGTGIERGEIQLLMRANPGGRGTFCWITVRSPRAGVYVQEEAATNVEPIVCEKAGFKAVKDPTKPTPPEIWPLPSWRRVVRWTVVGIGIGTVMFLLVRLFTR